mmetsp:Transcript_11090/g.13768  ORF Transcript_11090/g.13768 Transcript_11090/m.13768 type:complete len:181 (+) Transcript_11090:197-739(+)|eukprot:CAMPEP_0172486462 /NCGR_PEP_ID=MMETSP1066-20121228/15043_1 /TAXON_ID=671091 /ORGANISM="Coscinodiscus wailesii, Strain CCMP2513" /LENGTH=180 /DNA_ID=CAMNT_0013252433 /DNA_START=195 /DNA_END=737 /DNA_ORIENTATION=-
MTVHSLHIFDRKGKTLFTKIYSAAAAQQKKASNPTNDPETNSESRKLIFGMLFSLRELVVSLTPESSDQSLHSVRTGASTLHTFDTISGLKFVMYTDNNVPSGNVRDVLRHVYSHIWVETVVRSPLYRPGEIIPPEDAAAATGGGERNDGTILPVGKFEIRSTNFEKRLDEYLMSMSFFR